VAGPVSKGRSKTFKMSPQKRKCCSDEHPMAKKFKAPKNGDRSATIMYLSWENGPEIMVRVLLDTGATTFVLSDRLVEKHKLPYVSRKSPVEVSNFEGVSVSDAGKYYSFPLRFRLGDHYDKQTFEISPMDSSFDMVLLYWYLAKHKPSGFW
jgi:hypothetical protein